MPANQTTSKLDREKPPLLLTGASVRWAAQSAVRAGFDVLGADFFGDRDCRAACRDYLTVNWNDTPRQRSAAIEEFAANSGARVVPVGGMRLSNRPPDLESEISMLMNEMSWLRKAAARFGLAFPQTRLGTVLETPSTPHVRWLAKDLTQSGGLGVRWAEARSQHKSTVLQQFVSGQRFGWVGLVDDESCTSIGLTRSLIHRNRDFPFTYGGGLGPVDCPDFPDGSCCEVAESFASKFDYRGLINFDFIRSNDGTWWLLEVNDRPSASCELIESARRAPQVPDLETSLIGEHFAVRNGRRATWPRRIRGGETKTWVKKIVYSKHAGHFDYELAATRLKKVADSAVELHDIPSLQTRIEFGQPLATLLIQCRLGMPLATVIRSANAIVQSSVVS